MSENYPKYSVFIHCQAICATSVRCFEYIISFIFCCPCWVCISLSDKEYYIKPKIINVDSKTDDEEFKSISI